MKMFVKNKKLLIFVISSLIINIATIVSASSFNFEAKANKEVYKPEEEVIIDLNISDISAGQEGINVVELFLEYDKNIFNNIEFEKQNNWQVEYNDIAENNKQGKVLFVKMTSGVKNNEQIGKIRLKLKKDLDEIETKIKFKQITSNDGKELMHVNDKTVTIKVIKDKQENNNKEENKNFIEYITNLPKTGQLKNIYLILGAIIIIIVGILIYIKLKRNKKEKNNK